MFTHSTLRPQKSSRAHSKRLGRGSSSGKGGSSGRGCKGQKARTGKKIHPLFEGGQTPLHMRLPKLRGGAYSAKTPFVVIHLSDLENLAEKGVTDVTIANLLEAGIIRGKNPRVKLLSGGDIAHAVQVHVHAASTSAKSALEKAGGTLTLLEKQSIK